MSQQQKHYYATGGTFKGVRQFTTRGERDKHVRDTPGAKTLKADGQSVRAWLYAQGRAKRIALREKKQVELDRRRSKFKAAMQRLGKA